MDITENEIKTLDDKSEDESDSDTDSGHEEDNADVKVEPEEKKGNFCITPPHLYSTGTRNS